MTFKKSLSVIHPAFIYTQEQKKKKKLFVLWRYLSSFIHLLLLIQLQLIIGSE